jgi:hypothetical protein
MASCDSLNPEPETRSSPDSAPGDRIVLAESKDWRYATLVIVAPRGCGARASPLSPPPWQITSRPCFAREKIRFGVAFESVSSFTSRRLPVDAVSRSAPLRASVHIRCLEASSIEPAIRRSCWPRRRLLLLPKELECGNTGTTWRTAGIHGAGCRLCGRNSLLLPKQCLEAAVEALERARLGSRT